MALDPYFRKTVLASHFDEEADPLAQVLKLCIRSSDQLTAPQVVGTVWSTLAYAGSFKGRKCVQLSTSGAYYGVYGIATGFLLNVPFTIEAWVYITAVTAGANTTVFAAINGAADANGQFGLHIRDGNVLRAYWGGSYVDLVAAAVPRNQWAHIAVSCAGTQMAVFVNGVRVGIITKGGSGYTHTGIRVGLSGYGGIGFVGYVSDLRVYTVNKYSIEGDFAPLWPMPQIGNFTDSSPIERAVVGNGSALQPYTADAKFGGGGLRLDGASYLECAASADWNFGTGDFTIEAWVKPLGAQPIDGDGVNAGAVVFCTGGASGQNMFGLLMYSTDMLFYANNTTVLRLPVPDGWTQEWHHLAVTRQAGTVSLWFDGALLGSVAYATAIDGSTRKLYVGGRYYSNASYFWNSLALLDDVRITKGAARYTGNFTPPTEAFPDGQAGVSGVVRDADGVLCSRRLFAHSRATGRLLGTAVSNPTTGVYEIAAEEECYVVCLDSTDSLNAKIVDGVDPTA